MRAPWLSVIMPTYNGERYVRDALESVAAQEADGLELLVVDDGSTDRTLEIVETFDRRLPLRRISHPASGNWVRATNAGLRAATGRHSCILHQDDVWRAGRASTLRRLVARQGANVRLFLHPTGFTGPRGERLGAWGCPLPEGVVDSVSFVERLLVQNFIAIPAPVFDTELALRSGGLDDSLWYTADWDLWLRLGAAGPVRYVSETLAGFRVHAESQTSSRSTSFAEFHSQLTTVLDRHLERWPVQGRRRRRLVQVSRFSVDLNAALSAKARRQEAPSWARLLPGLLALGPLGWHEFLRDSRIVERVLPRLRLRLGSGADTRT